MILENIVTQVNNGILHITINRESKLNALNIKTLQEIKFVVEEAGNNTNVAAIILTGSGTKAFAAGADIAEFAEFDVAKGEKMSADGHAVMFALEKSSKPVIAAVNGFALGGGCELAMACHIRVASENAKFGQPEVNLGLIPGYAGTQRLIQLVGKGKALELLLTGDIINATEALHLGLVNHVVTLEQLMQKCSEIADKIKSKAPLAISKTIACVNAHFEATHTGFEMEVTEFGASFGTKDFKEGTQAFLNKRNPLFTGE